MPAARSILVRRIAAVLVVAAGCPGAMFGGALIGCASQGFSADCAMSGVFLSPLLLLCTGIAAGLLAHGWSGGALLLVGVAIGMTSLLVIAALLGRPLPFDPVQGIIAWVWFIAPNAAGYGLARGGVRLAGALA